MAAPVAVRTGREGLSNQSREELFQQDQDLTRSGDICASVGETKEVDQGYRNFIFTVQEHSGNPLRQREI
jgi:hypothetical protein